MLVCRMSEYWDLLRYCQGTHIGDEEDKTAREEDGGACHGERQEEASGVVHESSDHRTDCQAKVERGVAPSLHNF